MFLLIHLFYIYDYPPVRSVFLLHLQADVQQLVNALAATLLLGDPNAAHHQEGDADQLAGTVSQ